MRRSTLFRVAVVVGVLGLSGSFAVPAGAAPQAGPGRGRTTCAGTLKAPGVLSGTYSSNVTVTGVCGVSAGPAVVAGNLFVAEGAALVSVFAGSNLTVGGNVIVQSGATLVLGCEPMFSPCKKNPNGISHGHVSGNLIAQEALAVLVHASAIDGNVIQQGGGGGLSCAPPSTGIFSKLQSPVFSDYEDNTISGNVIVGGIQSCWFGALRNHVDGNVIVIGNSFGDPDANEVISNHIAGNAICMGNSPQDQFGDSMGVPNKVSGNALGECGFTTLEPNPEPNGPLTPISVHA